MTAATFERIAEIMRETHPDMVRIFTNGGCYQFYRLLHAVNPQAEAYHDGAGSHIFARLENTVFDISGARGVGRLVPLTTEPRILNNAKSWHREAFWTPSARPGG